MVGTVAYRAVAATASDDYCPFACSMMPDPPAIAACCSTRAIAWCQPWRSDRGLGFREDPGHDRNPLSGTVYMARDL